MRVLCLLVSLFWLGACGRADASTTALPTLTVSYEVADSAKIIARWSKPCDAKGCADSYRVSWLTLAGAAVKTTNALVDSIMVARPAIGDSAAVTIEVTAVRRGIASTTRRATALVRNPDAPPPPVDSLVIDTLAYEAAMLDSFPVVVVRDTLGHVPPPEIALRVGQAFQFCVLARHRYTGEVRIMVPWDAPPEADARLEVVCERAALAYATERDG